MSSQRRIASSRANGAKSRGPRTPETKQRSSRNALRHGLFARCIVLESESRECFDDLVAGLVARFAPADSVEIGFIEEMAAALWRMRRSWAVETRIFDDAIAATEPGDERARIAAAFTNLAATPQFNLLHRYETRLHRIFQRALHNLLLLREGPAPDETSVPVLPPPPMKMDASDTGVSGAALSEEAEAQSHETDPPACANLRLAPQGPSSKLHSECSVAPSSGGAGEEGRPLSRLLSERGQGPAGQRQPVDLMASRRVDS